MITCLFGSSRKDGNSAIAVESIEEFKSQLCEFISKQH